MKRLPQTITTIEIADAMGVTHKSILQKLEGSNRNGVHTKGIIETLSRLNFQPAEFFQESSYEDAQGKYRKCYKCTRKGSEFLAHKFTGEKGIKFTAYYIERFHDMEQALQQPQHQLPQKETYLLQYQKTWFERNNWRMKEICKHYNWERKYLYHKILIFSTAFFIF